MSKYINISAYKNKKVLHIGSYNEKDTKLIERIKNNLETIIGKDWKLKLN